MGKASSAKKVARAARTGGGRTRRGTTSWVFPGLMAMVVVLGTAGIVYSRDQHQPDNSRPLAAAAGVAGDHWHAALGFDICGTFAPNIPDSGTDPLGIHTHGDGVVHIHPFSTLSSGKRATLQIFFDTTNVTATATEIKLPTDNVTHKNGERCDAGTVGTATVQTKVWDTRDPADQGRIVTGSPAKIHPTDGMLITIAFVPAGTDIPRPPSAGQLDKLSDLGTQPTDASTDTTLPSDASASSTSSTVPADPNASTTSSTPSTTSAPTTTVASTTTTARP
jgi:hypothetical protein